MKVPKQGDIVSSGKTAFDGAVGGALTGIGANMLGGEIGVIAGGILAGAIIGGTHGEIVTMNAVQDAVSAMMMGGMGDNGSGGSVM